MKKADSSVRGGAVIVIALLLTAGSATALDLSTPQGSLAAMRKIQCSARDGKTETFGWHGNVFSRVPGERDRLLFRVEGMNIRQCGPLPDDPDGSGFRLVSREILLYLDPRSGQVLRQWKNPWTGKTVDVIHVSNDPVNQTLRAQGRGGRPFILPFSVQGDQWWLTTTVPLFYTNPLAGNYQKYVGGMYHATEMFNFFGNLGQLNDPAVDSVPASVGWVRISNWLPWMEMGGRAGLLYFHTAGRKLDRFEDLPAVMQTEISQHYPDYREPPPLDDPRPNETSWSFFKKVLDARKDAGR